MKSQVHQIFPLYSFCCLARYGSRFISNNLEQKFWGWSDPYAIYTLDYWLSLDENLTFILVYNHPRSVLEQAANNQESFVNNTIGHLIDNWIAYNTALLNFYYNNRERCH